MWKGKGNGTQPYKLRLTVRTHRPWLRASCNAHCTAHFLHIIHSIGYQFGMDIPSLRLDSLSKHWLTMRTPLCNLFLILEA